jgi:predicted RecB family nuclease
MSEWVTKSQVRQYDRCPYTFWLLYSGQITPAEVFGEMEKMLIGRGVGFEEAMLSEIEEAPPDVSLEELAKTARFLFNVPTARNSERKLIGRPDGIEIATFAPVEIKGHSKVTQMDRIELAFYWMLLEPERGKAAGEPYGWICRRGDPEPMRMALRKRDFDRTEYLIQAVRRARQDGVLPRVCYCHVCYGRPEVERLVEQREDVRLVWGVGPKNSKILNDAGVASLQTLVERHPLELAFELSAVSGRPISARQVATWGHHAKAITQNRAVRFSEERFCPDRYIVLDLEYDNMVSGGIWLFGINVVSGEQQAVTQVWSENKAGLARGLNTLASIVSAHSSLPVVTWNGTGADLPQLLYAARRRPALTSDLAERHVDFYHVVRRSLRFPTTSLDLKSISSHLGIKRKSKIADGLEALSVFGTYMRSGSDERRRRYRRQLLEYNRDDLEAIPSMLKFCHSIESDSSITPPAT